MASKIVNQNCDTKDVIAVIQTLKQFIGPHQLSALGDACRGEERQYFKNRLVELAGQLYSMPKTYEQDGLGDQAVAHLHYFRGDQDWYITERDCDPDGESQIQAFGLADLGYGGELGYISISEVIAANVELDLYWTPKTLGQIRAKAAA